MAHSRNRSRELSATTLRLLPDFDSEVTARQRTIFLPVHCVPRLVAAQLPILTRTLRLHFACEQKKRAYCRNDSVVAREGTESPLPRLLRVLQPAAFLRGARCAGGALARSARPIQRPVLQRANPTRGCFRASSKGSTQAIRSTLSARPKQSPPIPRHPRTPRYCGGPALDRAMAGAARKNGLFLESAPPRQRSHSLTLLMI